MKTPRWLPESQIALQAISQVAELFAGNRDATHAAREKETHRDLVTEWDLLVEKKVIKILQPHSPVIITEEQRAADQPISDETFRRSWWLDPIDGTVNFSLGLPMYGTSLAWMEDGRFVVGAALLPAQRELYFTYGDQGVLLNGRQVQLGEKAEHLGAALVGVTFSSPKVPGRTAQAREREYQLFGRINDQSRGAVRLGSALTQLCYLAVGRLQAVYGAFAQGWDVGAGLALAGQAGLEVRYVREPGTTRYHYVAGHPPVVAELASEFKNFNVQGLNRL